MHFSSPLSPFSSPLSLLFLPLLLPSLLAVAQSSYYAPVLTLVYPQQRYIGGGNSASSCTYRDTSNPSLYPRLPFPVSGPVPLVFTLSTDAPGNVSVQANFDGMGNTSVTTQQTMVYGANVTGSGAYCYEMGESRGRTPGTDLPPSGTAGTLTISFHSGNILVQQCSDIVLVDVGNFTVPPVGCYNSTSNSKLAGLSSGGERALAGSMAVGWTVAVVVTVGGVVIGW